MLFVQLALPAQEGELDLSFNGDGKYTLDLSYDDAGRCIALQPDGKILFGGYTYWSSGDMLIFRLDEYGNPDFAFGDQGIVQVDMNDEFQTANKIAVQADGKILAVGQSDSADEHGFLLVRLMPNGDLDYNFGDSGKVFRSLGVQVSTQTWNSLVVMPGGKVIVGGYAYIQGSGYEGVLVGLNANGSLNTSFGDSGTVRHKLATGSVYFFDMMLAPANKLLVVGRGYGQSDYSFLVERYNADGSLDPSFGGKGFVTIPFGGAPLATSVTMQKDGKIVVGGHGYINGYSQFAIVRLLETGLLDQSFGINGTASTAVMNGHAYLCNVSVLGDGKILASGNAEGLWNNDFALVRLSPDGSLDKSFHYDGIVTKNIGNGDDYAAAAILQPNGRLVVAGTSDSKSSSSTVISAARFLGGKGNIGLGEYISTLPVDIFPNPASEYLRIAPKDPFRFLQVRLIDRGGQVVKEELLTGTDKTIGVDNLPAGFYLLQVVIDQHEPQYHKLMITH